MRYITRIASALLVLAVAHVGVPTASLAQQGITTAPVEAVITLWAQEDENCRGGSGDDPATHQACGRRDVIDQVLQERGYCYGEEGEAGYQLQWRRCR